jgi:hypothetical protein
MTDTIRLTYRELAERLGIEPDSARIKARRLAKSGRWKLIPDNHSGAASTVEVPVADLVSEGAPGRTPPGTPIQTGQIRGERPRAPGGGCAGAGRLIRSLTARLEMADRQNDQVRADHAAELEQVRDELDRARQDAGLWREEADRERSRIANIQADTEHRAGDGAASSGTGTGAATVVAETMGELNDNRPADPCRPDGRPRRTGRHVSGLPPQHDHAGGDLAAPLCR